MYTFSQNDSQGESYGTKLRLWERDVALHIFPKPQSYTFDFDSGSLESSWESIFLHDSFIPALNHQKQ